MKKSGAAEHDASYGVLHSKLETRDLRFTDQALNQHTHKACSTKVCCTHHTRAIPTGKGSWPPWRAAMDLCEIKLRAWGDVTRGHLCGVGGRVSVVREIARSTRHLQATFPPSGVCVKQFYSFLRQSCEHCTAAQCFPSQTGPNCYSRRSCRGAPVCEQSGQHVSAVRIHCKKHTSFAATFSFSRVPGIGLDQTQQL